ncbi:MAG TPA: hypothetical protein VJ461_06750 [Candidatus Nanoarchaeia archaeon]|nr:hypothetical protein [Candidatus Nanoarchaeia archaeon]
MSKKKRGQAAFEYLSTYGWAILSALIAIGALAYFGFLNPNKLLPNNCDFGKQLECVEYRLVESTGQANVFFRNNFGKPIAITGVSGDVVNVVSPALPFTINSGAKQEVMMTLDNPGNYLKGDKKEVRITIVFERADVSTPPSHNITGTVFTTVQ